MTTIAVHVTAPTTYKPRSGQPVTFLPGLLLATFTPSLDRDPVYVLSGGQRMSHDAFADRLVNGEFRAEEVI